MGNEHFLDDKSNQTGNQTANRTEGGEQCKERQTAEQGSAPSISGDQKYEAKREPYSMPATVASFFVRQ